MRPWLELRPFLLLLLNWMKHKACRRWINPESGVDVGLMMALVTPVFLNSTFQNKLEFAFTNWGN
jgi:hypothetical protein